MKATVEQWQVRQYDDAFHCMQVLRCKDWSRSCAIPCVLLYRLKHSRCNVLCGTPYFHDNKQSCPSGPDMSMP